MKSIIIFTISCLFCLNVKAQSEADKILGKWMSEANDLKVEIYQQNGQYHAKVIWFKCNAGHQMSEFFDTENPDKALRNRPWLGLQVLDKLRYGGGLEWKNGNIYDPNSGHIFSSVCRLQNTNTLSVRGYWHYEWIGKNMTFTRVNS
jgi:uncharacterized protein (DUF2147 family)